MPSDKSLNPRAPRVFGSLKKVVRIDGGFFSSLPIAEQDTWDGNSERDYSQSQKESDAPNADDRVNDRTP
jgi:hypothetical protein